MVTGKKTGHPVRSLRTQFARDYAKAEFSGGSEEVLHGMSAGAFRRAVQDGDPAGCFLSGQVAAMVHREQNAAEIIQEIMAEAEPLLREAMQWVK